MQKVIIDCDPGIDDSLAIMLALKSPEIEVLGITVVAGNAPVEMGYGNAKKVLRFLGRLDIPVYLGADRPRKREYINALDTHGADGLGESFLPAVEDDEIPDLRAVDFLEQELKKGGVSIVALGPLTNIAKLCDRNPNAMLLAERVISMGGNFRSHGNCSPVAEYNYWEDPDSAKRVYSFFAEHNRQIEMVGLDVTRKIVLTPEILDAMIRQNASVGQFVKKITGFYFQFHWEWEHIRGCVINDPLAMAQLLDDKILEGFASFVDVETESISIGQTVVDSMGFYRKSPNAIVYTKVDEKRFWELFLSRILQIPKEQLSSGFDIG